MKKQLSGIAPVFLVATLLWSQSALSQSTDERQPTPVSGSSIRSVLTDTVDTGPTVYYYTMNLNAGANTALLRVKLSDCSGQSISVYVDGQPNVFPSTCDGSTRTASGELDFTLRSTKNVLITVYVSGSDGERFDLDLSFRNKTAPIRQSAIPSKISCTYADRFALSDTSPKYERVYRGLVFKKGSAQMFITAFNNEGTNISGTVYAEQTDRGRYNENFVLPVDGFGGTIGTPLTNAPVREPQFIGGKGKGNIRILFEQNGNGTPKTGSYKLVVTGDAIVSCGDKANSLY